MAGLSPRDLVDSTPAAHTPSSSWGSRRNCRRRHPAAGRPALGRPAPGLPTDEHAAGIGRAGRGLHRHLPGGPPGWLARHRADERPPVRSGRGAADLPPAGGHGPVRSRRGRRPPGRAAPTGRLGSLIAMREVRVLRSQASSRRSRTRRGVLASGGPGSRRRRRRRRGGTAGDLLVGNGGGEAVLEVTLQGPASSGRWPPTSVWPGPTSARRPAASSCRPATRTGCRREPSWSSAGPGRALAATSPSKAGSSCRRSSDRSRRTCDRASAASTAERSGPGTSCRSPVGRTGRCDPRIGPGASAVTDEPLSFIPCPSAFGWFTPDAVRGFCAARWTVGRDSDRLGIRLGGAVIPSLTGGIPSLAVPVGAVQVPPGGAPIVKLVDGPVTGGYPVLGVVPRFEHARLARPRRARRSDSPACR